MTRRAAGPTPEPAALRSVCVDDVEYPNIMMKDSSAVRDEEFYLHPLSIKRIRQRSSFPGITA